MGEERLLAEEGDEHRVRDDAREDARDERVGLEVVAVQHLDGEQRGAEGRAEDGGHARGGAGDEQDAPLALGDAKQLADERADGAAHLHRRPLAPARAADAEGERRDDGLHERDALADDAVVLVKRLDDGVAAAAARLGREPDRDGAAEERPDRRHERAGARGGTAEASSISPRSCSPPARSGT